MYGVGILLYSIHVHVFSLLIVVFLDRGKEREEDWFVTGQICKETIEDETPRQQTDLI